MTNVRLDGAQVLENDLLKPYQVPTGYYDRFFTQVWNPPFMAYTSVSGIGTSALSPPNYPPAVYRNPAAPFDLLQQGLTIPGDYDFVLRAVAMPSDMCRRFQLYTPGMSRLFDLPLDLPPSTGTPENTPIFMPVIPEIIYPANSQIVFDLLGMKPEAFAGTTPIGTPPTAAANQIYYRAGVSDPVRIYTGQLVFYGVQRYRGNLRNPAESSYAYQEKSFSYHATFNHNFSQFAATAVPVLTFSTQPLRLRVPIRNYDFELRRINFSMPNLSTYSFATPGPGSWGGIEAGPMEGFRVQIYDGADQPLSGGYSGFQNTGIGPNGTGMQPKYWGYQLQIAGLAPTNNITLPCPPILYPQNSQITIDVLSMLGPQNLPANNPVTITFDGVQRVPSN